MKRQHTYEKIIGRKLNGLAAPDVAGLWDQMETILDREMPQQEKKKRLGAWWLNPNLLLAASLALAIGGAYTFNSLTSTNPATQSAANTSPTERTVTSPLAAPGRGSKPESKTGTASVAKSKEEAAASAVSAVAGLHRVAGKGRLQTFVANKKNASRSSASEPDFTITNAPENTSFEKNTALLSAGKNETLLSDIKADGNNAPVIAGGRNALAEVELVKPTLPAAFDGKNLKPLTLSELKRKLNLRKRSRVYSDKGVSIGVALNYPIGVHGQMKTALDMNGRSNKWQDYLPSLYAQLHLNRKVYVQAEWQPVAAQYTKNYTLYHNVDEPSPDEKEEKIIQLNKLFYTSIPVSVHYKTPLKNVTVGVGLQYSLLKKMILQDQQYYEVIGPGRWDTLDRQNDVSVKNPAAVRDHSSGDVADNVAKAFRREDWRLLADLGYQYNGLSAGLRYTRGLHYYYNSNFTSLPVKARNESLQVYLRYNLFDSRKK